MKNFSLALGFVISFFMMMMPVIMLFALNNNHHLGKVEHYMLFAIAFAMVFFGIMLAHEITKSRK